MSIMSRWQRLERDFFRALNSVVEPAVRRGVASPRYTPGSLIVLESTGFKSGQQRRTPLAALRLGRYILVGTARGNRSFWPRNLANEPEVTYYTVRPGDTLGLRWPTPASPPVPIVHMGASMEDSR